LGSRKKRGCIPKVEANGKKGNLIKDQVNEGGKRPKREMTKSFPDSGKNPRMNGKVQLVRRGRTRGEG